MRQSKLFTKTRREAPSDEISKNAELLIRAGFINKEMAGVYSLLPLGFKVVNNIKKIISKEMENLGSNEIIMSSLQDKSIWQKTDRWDDEKVDIWFKTNLKNGTEIGLGWSHEEPISEMVKSHISSYNDLPILLHQFQNKLRNEVRAKSGIMRCREFVMKDMYYFARTEEENNSMYNLVAESYKKVFEILGLDKFTYLTSASGGMFTDRFSHEFQTICEAGEDNIYVHKNEKLAFNEEIFNSNTLKDAGMKVDDFMLKKSAEVGNIFNFGTKKSEQMELFFTENNGDKKPVFLSSYGIGVTRLMGVIAEVFSNENGLIWPESIAPFRWHIIYIPSRNIKVRETAENIYSQFNAEDAIYDDRDMRAGEKFYDADLLGIPNRIVVSEKSLDSGLFEYKNIISGDIKMLNKDDLFKFMNYV